MINLFMSLCKKVFLFFIRVICLLLLSVCYIALMMFYSSAVIIALPCAISRYLHGQGWDYAGALNEIVYFLFFKR